VPAERGCRQIEREMDSFRAPVSLEYTKLASYCVTPWVSSRPMTSSEAVKSWNNVPSPSPNIICEPSQNALL